MRRKINRLTIVAGSLAGLALIALLGTVWMVRTEWFQNYVREKIISSVEDSTGGKVDVGDFRFDPHTLTATVTDFVLHGTEPPGAAPLLLAPRITLQIKLFAKFRRPAVLEYLGVDRPAANVIVLPDGGTNLPTPRTKSSKTSGLETLVNLAIRRLEINQGTAHLFDQSIPLDVRGRDLQLTLVYNMRSEHYQGALTFWPVLIHSGDRPPIEARIDVPIDMGADAVQITSARIGVGQSIIYTNVSVEHLADPLVSLQTSAHISLDDLARSVDLPIHPQGSAIEASASIASHANAITISNARVTLGSSQISAFGDLRKGAQIYADLALPELAAMFALSPRPSGNLQIAATARMPKDGQFVMDGSLTSRGLSYEQFRDVRLASAFRVGSDAMNIVGLTVNALGGELRADGKLEHFSRLTIAAKLRDFTIRNIATALLTKPVDYAGVITGSMNATGTIQGAMQVGANLKIRPGGQGVPVSGDLQASFDTRQAKVVLHPSRIQLPATQMELSGIAGEDADVRIVSHNLADFSPVANVTSYVQVKGGSGTASVHMHGPLLAPQISGGLQLSGFTVKGRAFNQLSADFRASASSAVIENGTLERNGARAQFSGSVGLDGWKVNEREPVTAKFSTNRSDASDFLALAGSNIPISGPVTANVAIAGTVGNPRGSVQIGAGPGAAYGEPFDRLDLAANLSDQRVDLTTFALTVGPARLEAHGVFTHPKDDFETGRIELHADTDRVDLAQFKTLAQRHAGLAGAIALHADVMGNLTNGPERFVPSSVNGSLTATGLRDQRQSYGDLTLNASTSGSDVTTRIDSDFAGSRIGVTARTSLQSGYATTADASIRSLPIDKAAEVAGASQIGARGMLSADAHFTGTLDDPHAQLTFELVNGALYHEPLNRVTGSANYAGRLATVSSLRIVSPAGTTDIHGSYAHSAGNYTTGKLEASVSAPGVDLHRVQAIVQNEPRLGGLVRLNANVTVDLRKENGHEEIRPLDAEIKGSVDRAEWRGKALGQASFEGHTAADVLLLNLDAALAGAQIRGTGQVHLNGDYPGDAKVTLANLRLASVEAALGSDTPIDGLVEGEANFSGPFLHPQDGTGQAQLSRVELSAKQNGFRLASDGPVTVKLSRSILEIEHARLTGTSTNLDVSGRLAMNESSPMDLKVGVNLDLAVLRNFDKDVYSDGSVTVNANLRGTFSNPQATGSVVLKDAALQLADWPNGISQANGSIILNGRSARFNSITAQTGGGKLTIDGTASMIGTNLALDLRANAQQVHARYSGASITANAALTLTGNPRRSVLGGNVTITRVGYTQQSDIGQLLSGAAAPPPASTSSAGLASRVRLRVRIQTSSGVRFQTDLAQQLSATADLTLLGTLASPGMSGRVNITSGSLVFFGNTYTVNRGAVSFYNPSSIQPMLDVDLETTAQGVQVDLTVSGPIDNLKLSYRSDPPLKFGDVIALLATGKTPPDPNIAVNQPYSPDLSATQMGESAVLGQAIANPLASRLQRVFGVTQLKVAPSFENGSSLPGARVTLQQQVSTAITFTYSQDLNQANSELVSVAVKLSPRFSAVATRDENGIFGVDFYYRKQFH